MTASRVLAAVLALAAIPREAAAVRRGCEATGAFELEFTVDEADSPTTWHRKRIDILRSDMKVVASAYTAGVDWHSYRQVKEAACDAAALCFVGEGAAGHCPAGGWWRLDFETILMPDDPDHWRREIACGHARAGNVPGVRNNGRNEVTLSYTRIFATGQREDIVRTRDRLVSEHYHVCWKPKPQPSFPPTPRVPPEPPEPEPRPRGPNVMTQQFGVTAAELSLAPNQATTADRVALRLLARATANGPGRGKARVVHNGAKGPVFDLVFKKAGTFSESLPPIVVQCPRQTPGASKKASTSPGSNGGPRMAGTPPNVKTGTVHLELVATPGIVKSKPAAYSVTCEDRPEPTIVHLALPDLRVAKHDFSPAPAGAARLAAATASLMVVVENAGSAASGATRLTVTGREDRKGRRWSARIPPLDPGEKAEIRVTLASDGPVEPPLVVLLDASEKVTESNERNNRYTVP